MYEVMLMRKAKSWFTGYNSNVPGHEEGKIRYFVYNGGTPKFVKIINGIAAKGYEEITFSSNSGPEPNPLHLRRELTSYMESVDSISGDRRGTSVKPRPDA
jgi:hypothetical protein